MQILPAQEPSGLKQVGCWRAWLNLEFMASHGKTILKNRDHYGPLTVQRPFYPEGNDVCHTYLIHPPGGMVGGDHIQINANVSANAHALMTTPSAGKMYYSTGAESVQHQYFHLGPGAGLEWLPQETIVFNGSKARLITQVALEDDARFMGWDMVCLGRPASKDYFASGSCTQNFQLYRNNKPILLERFNTSGRAENRRASWGLSDHNLLATFVATGVTKDMLATTQAMVNDFNHGQAGITLIDDTLVCRCLTHQARFAKTLFVELWQTLRPQVFDRPAEHPRIWLT